MKKDKDKKERREALFEGLLEILLTLVFFGIGALIVRMCGFELDASYIDFDLIVLLGILVPIVVFGLVYACVRWLKKFFKGK